MYGQNPFRESGDVVSHENDVLQKDNILSDKKNVLERNIEESGTAPNGPEPDIFCPKKNVLLKKDTAAANMQGHLGKPGILFRPNFLNRCINNIQNRCKMDTEKNILNINEISDSAGVLGNNKLEDRERVGKVLAGEKIDVAGGMDSDIKPPQFVILKNKENGGVGCPILYDEKLFENEINKNQLKSFEKIYYYKDIKFYFNLYQDYKKSGVLEIFSYWMGILDGPIHSTYDEFDIVRLLNNDMFIHNLKFCLILFVYNSNIETIIREKINFPLLIYNVRNFSYFTNDTDLLFDWNENLELFSIGYEFDISHYIETVPKFFLKHWILFDNDFPVKLSDFCVNRYGANWREDISNKYNVQIKFLNNETAKDKRTAYETLFKMYKQCIYYVSYAPENIEKNKPNWYYECLLNGTPILTTDENEFGFYDYNENYYNMVFTDENTWNLTNYETCTYAEYIRNLFNTKNIQKMSSLIYRMRTNLIDYKVNIIDYFKFVHFTIFKLNRAVDSNNVYNQLIAL